MSLNWETADTLKSRIAAYEANHVEFVGWVMDLLGPVQGKSLLDLGCGVGTFLKEACQGGAHRVVGMDINESMVRVAQQAAPCAVIVHRSFDDPWPGFEPFDTAMAIYSAYYSKDIALLMRMLSDSIVQGGRLVVVGPSPLPSWEVVEHRKCGLPVPPLLGNEKAGELVSRMSAVFGPVTVYFRVNRLEFLEVQQFMSYYCASALFKQLSVTDQRRAQEVMSQRATEEIGKRGVLLVEKEVWGLVAVNNQVK